MTGGGWIKLHRRLQDSKMWTERRTFSKAEAWIDLLFSARWQKAPQDILIGMHTVTVRRGECLKTTREWGKRWEWSAAKVHRFFKLLQKRNSIRYDNETAIGRVTIVNYESYQGDVTTDETEMKHERNTNETQMKRLNNKEEEGEEGEELNLGFGDKSPPPNGCSGISLNGKANDKTKPRTKARMDEISDALIDLFGLVIATSTDQKNIGRWRRDIYDKIAADSPPPDGWGEIVRNRYSRWPGLYPNATLTVDALVKHWDALKYHRRQPV